MSIFFRLFYKLHLSGLKSILYYPEYQKMFLSGSFCFKTTYKKKVDFLRKTMDFLTKTLWKMSIFLTLQELHFSGLKSILYYPEYEKMFLFGLFWLKKNIWKKVRFVEKNNGLTPLQNVDFFLLLGELNFWGPKSCIFYSGYKKMFLSGSFCYKTTYKKKVDFLTKPKD